MKRYRNKYGALVTEWGPVDNIGTPVPRIGGLGVRGTSMTIEDGERRDFRELVLDALEALLNSVPGASINESWFEDKRRFLRDD